MQALGATVVAIIALCVVDQFLFDGRYFGVIFEALRQVGLLVGIHA